MNPKHKQLLKEIWKYIILEKKILGADLEKEETEILVGWELFVENLYGANISDDVLKQEFLKLVEKLQREKQKETRLKDAKGFGK